MARQRLAVGQPELDFGPDFAALQAGSGAGGGPLAITSSRMGYLWDVLGHAYQLLGFEEAAGGDEVFRLLVLARIVEPTSKLDSLRPAAWQRSGRLRPSSIAAGRGRGRIARRQPTNQRRNTGVLPCVTPMAARTALSARAGRAV